MKSYLSEPGQNYEDFQDSYGHPYEEVEKSGYIKKYKKAYFRVKTQEHQPKI